MARLSSTSLSFLVYFIVMVAGGVAAKAWHEARMEKMIYSAPFRVPAPPSGAMPGESVDVRYENFQIGNHEVWEMGNLRVAMPLTEQSQNHYGSHGSGSFGFVIPDPAKEHQSNRSTINLNFDDTGVEVVNGELELDGQTFSVLGPKRLVVIDQSLRILSDTLLEE